MTKHRIQTQASNPDPSIEPRPKHRTQTQASNPDHELGPHGEQQRQQQHRVIQSAEGQCYPRRRRRRRRGHVPGPSRPTRIGPSDASTRPDMPAGACYPPSCDLSRPVGAFRTGAGPHRRRTPDDLSRKYHHRDLRLRLHFPNGQWLEYIFRLQLLSIKAPSPPLKVNIHVPTSILTLIHSPITTWRYTFLALEAATPAPTLHDTPCPRGRSPAPTDMVCMEEVLNFSVSVYVTGTSRPSSWQNPRDSQRDGETPPTLADGVHMASGLVDVDEANPRERVIVIGYGPHTRDKEMRASTAARMPVKKPSVDFYCE
jgi:hypothetical protein